MLAVECTTVLQEIIMINDLGDDFAEFAIFLMANSFLEWHMKKEHGSTNGGRYLTEIERLVLFFEVVSSNANDYLVFKYDGMEKNKNRFSFSNKVFLICDPFGCNKQLYPKSSAVSKLRKALTGALVAFQSTRPLENLFNISSIKATTGGPEPKPNTALHFGNLCSSITTDDIFSFIEQSFKYKHGKCLAPNYILHIQFGYSSPQRSKYADVLTSSIDVAREVIEACHKKRLRERKVKVCVYTSI